MSSHPTTGLKRRPQYRVAGVRRNIHRWHHRLNLGGVKYLAINTVQPVCVGSAINIAHVLQGVAQVHDAALAEHHIKVKFLA